MHKVMALTVEVTEARSVHPREDGMVWWVADARVVDEAGSQPMAFGGGWDPGSARANAVGTALRTFAHAYVVGARLVGQ